MISKEQFLELKHLKSLGVPTSTICKKIGISVPSANKWLRMDEFAFEKFKMKDMYDRNLWVYFFCMVLSYSRMRFVYFSREPFRTKTAIEAHKYAFRYFGGRTQTILYDQDKVFVCLSSVRITAISSWFRYLRTLSDRQDSALSSVTRAIRRRRARSRALCSM